MARPWVHMNCACSLDGRIAAPDGSPMSFSDDVDWRRVHALRARSDAILVGVGTVLSDDPSLRVKEEHYPHTFRDPRGRTPQDARVTDGSANTVIMHGPGLETDWPACDQTELALDEEGHLDLGQVLEELAARKVRRLLVEGGGAVLKSFVRTGLCDVWTLYQAPVLVGGDGPQLWPGKPSGQGRRLHVESVEQQGKGVLWTLRP